MHQSLKIQVQFGWWDNFDGSVLFHLDQVNNSKTFLQNVLPVRLDGADRQGGARTYVKSSTAVSTMMLELLDMEHKYLMMTK